MSFSVDEINLIYQSGEKGREGTLDSAVTGIVEMSYNWLFMELRVTLFEGCGKAVLCYSMCCEQGYP